LAGKFSQGQPSAGQRTYKKSKLTEEKAMALFSDIIPWRSSGRELGGPQDPFNYLRSQIDRVFDDAFGGRGGWLAERGRVFAPQLEITETDKEVKVCAELPGIEPKDLDVNVTDQELTIRGEKRSERAADEKEGRYWTERTYGSFERTISLPTEIDGSKATSEFKNGVLRITFPKREEARQRSHKISVT
jgi:HSP20 family protein